MWTAAAETLVTNLFERTLLTWEKHSHDKAVEAGCAAGAALLLKQQTDVGGVYSSNWRGATVHVVARPVATHYSR